MRERLEEHPLESFPKCNNKEFRFPYDRDEASVGARAPFVYAVCQCAGLDSRGFNTLYRGDCCSLSACSTQPDDRLSSHRRGAQPPFVRVPWDLLHAGGRGFQKDSTLFRRFFDDLAREIQRIFLIDTDGRLWRIVNQVRRNGEEYGDGRNNSIHKSFNSWKERK